MKQNYDISTLNRRYVFKRQLVTNITLEYVNDTGSKWGVLEMIRESTQNMLDEALYQARTHGGDISDYFKVAKKTEWHSGKVTHFDLRDFGRGVNFESIFFLGASGKRGQDYKGHKGEGEVLSFLVAAREGIEKFMFSKTWAAKPVIVTSGGYQVLALDVYETTIPIDGTVWRYEWNSKVEYVHDNLSHYFPELSKREMRKQDTREKKYAEKRVKSWERQQKQQERELRAKSTISTKVIMTPREGRAACLYVRGVYVKDLNSLFSYNLDVEINRDRSMVDELLIIGKIQEAWNSDDLTEKQCKIYWEQANNREDCLEYRRAMKLTNGHNIAMLHNAFKKTFGKRAFIPTNPQATLDGMSLGWKKIDLPNYVKDTALFLSIDTDKSILGYQGDVIPLDPTATHKKLISKLEQIGKALGFSSYPVNCVKKVLNLDFQRLGGWYQNGEIYLLEHRLNGDRLDLLKVYIHEAGHGESNASDGTRDFTSFFEGLLIKALVGRYDKIRPLIDELLSI